MLFLLLCYFIPLPLIILCAILLKSKTVNSVLLLLLQIEGVAYRGRLMVEVEMNLERLPATRTEDFKNADYTRFKFLMRRRKYKLYGAFFSATMVRPSDKPVEFEVSIGHYGNNQDEILPI